MPPRYVYGVGPSNAKLMIVGEAPGKKEEELGKPFVGPSGEILDDLLNAAGMNRSQCYITNIVKIRPPDNQLDRLGEIDNPDSPEEEIMGEICRAGYKIDDFLPLFWKEVKAVQPNCILGLGATALQYITGKETIGDWRGSILSALDDRPTKVVCTYHPASLFERPRNGRSGEGMFSWKQKVVIQFDVRRAVEQSKFPEINRPPHHTRICRSSLDLTRFLSENRNEKFVAVDCEVYKANLVCVGLSFNKYEALAIPLINIMEGIENDLQFSIPLNDMVEIWRILAEFLADESVAKIGQNFHADQIYWLEKAGFEVKGKIYDLLYLMAALYPELPKALQFSTSIYTEQPFYKNEGRSYNPKKDKLDVLLNYNGMDAMVTYEAFFEARKDAEEICLLS